VEGGERGGRIEVTQISGTISYTYICAGGEKVGGRDDAAWQNGIYDTGDTNTLSCMKASDESDRRISHIW